MGARVESYLLLQRRARLGLLSFVPSENSGFIERLLGAGATPSEDSTAKKRQLERGLNAAKEIKQIERAGMLELGPVVPRRRRPTTSGV